MRAQEMKISTDQNCRYTIVLILFAVTTTTMAQGSFLSGFGTGFALETSIYSNIGYSLSETGIAGNIKISSGSLNGFVPTVTKTEGNTNLRKEVYALAQNYPNPFNPSTIIKYAIPKSGMVSIIIYDLLGRATYKLVNEEKPAGNYEVNFRAINMASGIYFYQMRSGDYVETKKFVLLK
jgi:hypothetical protein